MMKPSKSEFYHMLGKITGMLDNDSMVASLIDDGWTISDIEELQRALRNAAEVLYR